MVKVIKKNNYNYLQKGFRIKGKLFVREEYLGKEVPKNIVEVKNYFSKTIRDERFLKDIITIQKNYQKEFKSMPDIAKRKSLEYFAVKFTYNSQAIEGSTITLKETKFLVEDGFAPAKSIKEIDETREHHKLFFEMLDYKEDLSMQLVLFWHKRLFERSYPDIAGKIRTHNIKVAGSKAKFPDHIEVEYLLDEFFKWYKKNKTKYNPVELAALVHLKFVSIHPFSDGNGRMSRLIMNFVLHKNNFPMVDIPYKGRESYYNALEKSNLNNDENYFIEYIIKKYLEEYKEYLKK